MKQEKKEQKEPQCQVRDIIYHNELCEIEVNKSIIYQEAELERLHVRVKAESIDECFNAWKIIFNEIQIKQKK